MAPQLNVTDRDGFVAGRIEARVGLQTRAGKITRVSLKSMWIGDRRYVASQTYMPGVSARFAKGAA